MAHTVGIRGLDVGPDGRIWAGAVNEFGFFEDRAGQWRYHTLTTQLASRDRPIGEVWYAFAEGSGATFVSRDSVLRWDGRKLAVTRFADVRRLTAMRANGTVYVHDRQEGLYEVGPHGLHLVIPRSQLGDVSVVWIKREAGDWLLLTDAGFLRWDGHDARPVAGAASDFVRRSVPTAACLLRDGRLAIGTLSGGVALVRADGALERVYASASGLPSNEIWALGADREGGIWCMSSEGVARIDAGSDVTVFGRSSGWPAQPCRGIAGAGAGITASTLHALYAWDARAGRFKRATPDLDGDGLYGFWEDSSNLLACRHTGLYALRGRDWQPIWRAGYDVIGVHPAFVPGAGYFVLTNHQIAAVSRDLQRVRVIAPSLDDYGTSIVEDAAHTLWLGGMTLGVQTVDEQTGAVSPPPARTGLPRGDGSGWVAAGPGGQVIAFVNDAAWFRDPAGGRFQRVDAFPRRSVAFAGTFGASVWAILPSESELPAAIGRIAFGRGTARWIPVPIDGLERVGNPKTLYAETGSAGWTLWVGGSGGLIRSAYDPAAPLPIPPSPLISLYQRAPATGALTAVIGPLPFAAGPVTVELSIPEFSDRAALRPELWIQGIDSGWTLLGSSSRRELAALREGHYLIRARTLAATGAVSAEAVARLVILPPWWRTWEAELAGLALAAGAAYGVYRWRVRQLRRSNLELEEKVRLRTAAAERANAAKTDFIARISHDLRNPLNGIVGLAFALERNDLPDADRRRYLEAMRGCAGFLTNLIEDVLDFSQIEAGRIELRPRAFSPRAILEQVAAALRTEAESRGARFHLAVAPELPGRLLADAVRVQEIVFNYATNAVKYAGGDVVLAAARRGPSEVEFSVCDSGPGLSEHEKAEVFEKFVRLNAGAARESGTGLGLSICRSLAHLLGGAAGVDSEPGRGSRFWLRIPLVEAAGDAAPAARGYAFLRILLVEDLDYNAWAASAVLERLGLKITSRARTGTEALSLLEEGAYDLVLLDRNLPDRDGLEVARAIRAADRGERRLVIVAITAHSTAEDRQLCLEAGMDAFVGKPLTPEKVDRVLAAHVAAPMPAASVHVYPQAAVPAPSPFDLGLLRELAARPGELELEIKRLLGAIGAEKKALYEALAWTLGADPAGEGRRRLASAAHRIAGLARFVEATRVVAAAEALEHALCDGQGEGLDALCRAIDAETVRLELAFIEILAEPRTA